MPLREDNCDQKGPGILQLPLPLLICLILPSTSAASCHLFIVLEKNSDGLHALVTDSMILLRAFYPNFFPG